MTSEHGFTDSARSSWSIHHFQQSRADQMIITVSIQPASSNPSIHRGSWETFHKVIPPKDVHLSERSWASRRCSMMKVIARPVSSPQKRRLLVACPQQRVSVTCAASPDETVHNRSGSTYGLPDGMRKFDREAQMSLPLLFSSNIAQALLTLFPLFGIGVFNLLCMLLLTGGWHQCTQPIACGC